MIRRHEDSHVDHGIPHGVMNYVLDQFKDRTEFFIETFEYPESYTACTSLSDWNNPGMEYEQEMPPVRCDLHLDVPEGEVFYEKRGDRGWESRLCNREPRMTREITIIAGPHPEDKEAGMILFTMYGGPAAPREPGDPSLEGEALEESKKFWSRAALSNRHD